MLDENVNAETLQRFPVMIFPNAGSLRAEEVNLFSAYVENGGKLIITGLSGCYDRMGVPAGNSALEVLIGAHLVEALPAKDNWVRLSGEMPEALRASIPVDWPFLVKGPAAVYQPDTAQALGELIKPYRTTRQKEGKEGTEWPMSPDMPVGPALLLNRLGKGEVLTFAASPDYATASEHAIVEARRLLVNAVRYLHPNPRVQITAPVTVQAVVSDDPETRTLRVHLLCYNSPPQTTPAVNRPYVLPGLIEDTPSYWATITTSTDIQEVKVFNPETRLSRQGNEIELIANDIHEIVLLYY